MMAAIKSFLQRMRIDWIRRRFHEDIVDFGKHLRSAGRIAVLLPDDASSRKTILTNSDMISGAFPDSEICLISMPDDSVREFARQEGYRSFAPNKTELSWYGFPSSGFFERIKNLRSNVVIDLEPARSCFNAAVSVTSGAPLRFGVFGSWGRPIHNVVVKTEESDRSPQPLVILISTLYTLCTGASN
jgi:hypothetical protein